MKLSFADRFWAKVDRCGPNGCWLWTAARYVNGYGQFPSGSRPNRTLVAHRVAFELLVGPIPDGLTLDHFRLNPGARQAPCSRLCVNPAHLEPVTRGENVLRGNASSARCARRSSCAHGHVYDSENTRIVRGARQCKTCQRLWANANYAENKAAINERRRARLGFVEVPF